MSTIISTLHLQSALKPGATDTESRLTNACQAATNFINSNAVRYHTFDNITAQGITQAPAVIVMYCKIIAKIFYHILIGDIFLDGSEEKTWNDMLDKYRKIIRELEIEPSVHQKVISLDTNGCMLITRNQQILPYHPDCKVVSSASPQEDWNQDEHWTIRKGGKWDEENTDGWYFDASTYKDEIEGTLYYARSYRNDNHDYLTYGKVDDV